AAILQNSNDLLITQLWPNPVTDKAQLSISSGSTTKGRLLLLNMAGQVVLEQSIALAEGSRIIELDLSHLPAGIYQGRVQAGLRNAGFRLVKK
ncbi:MAG TPA: T9SS type A sorting domain-containing protein, partial [Chitinophagaceae bacterium]|nr:T9SS type A sorting domain-containing protein [Chitinophagaceae bacterium]